MAGGEERPENLARVKRAKGRVIERRSFASAGAREWRDGGGFLGAFFGFPSVPPKNSEAAKAAACRGLKFSGASDMCTTL